MAIYFEGESNMYMIPEDEKGVDHVEPEVIKEFKMRIEKMRLESEESLRREKIAKRATYITAYKDMRDFWAKIEKSKFLSEWDGKPYDDCFSTYIEKYFKNEVPKGFEFRASPHKMDEDEGEDEYLFMRLDRDKSSKDDLNISSTVFLFIKEKNSIWPCIIDESGRIDVAIIKKGLWKQINYLDKRIGILKNFDPQKMIELHGQLENEIKAWDKTIPFEFSEFKIFED
ncbi:hypothetical protein EROP_29300 [Erysipelotrichaceae bacterium OPF54]|nr:hypothetical protein EROP_29300 [Erysipelotrichaceae bacterium OPF54]